MNSCITSYIPYIRIVVISAFFVAMNDVSIDGVKVKLEKKNSFHAGLIDLTRLLSSTGTDEQGTMILRGSLYPLIARSITLLKSRHINLVYWRAARECISTALHLKFTPDQLAKLQVNLHDVTRHLTEQGEQEEREERAGASSTNAHADGIINILMGGGGAAGERHYDDAGLIIDEGSERWERAQISGTLPSPPPSDESSLGHAGGLDAPQSDQDIARRARNEERRRQQREILRGIQAIQDGMEAVAQGQENASSELDSLLESVMSRSAALRAAAASMEAAGNQPIIRPPASKKLLASLPIITVDESSLKEWGPEGSSSSCPVCTCEYEVGDRVQVLPCKHKYHPQCVKPWLDKHNTCPLCRTEMLTDDADYEAKKEKAKEEEEERRGAANALRGGEFMYI